MSIMCKAEKYSAFRIILRISSLGDIRDSAVLLARKAEEVFGTDGCNITYGDGRWKGETEPGAAIEIVVKNNSDLINWDYVLTRDLTVISDYVNLTLGLTCFATVDSVTAFELYELSQ